MCGISGLFAFNEIGRFALMNLANVNETLAHRGPDASRLFDEYYVGLAHRRLSIIDLSPNALQPMSDASERYTIAFNGEIYNYQALRKDLEAKGVQFKSESDTEVLLQLYIHEREKCLEKLHGFFAFAIYDKEEELLFLARDRYGIKPLLYYWDEDKFVFASEMSALLNFNIPKEIDYSALFHYFQLNYIPAPLTIFKNTFKLPSGHYMKVKKREVATFPYYQIPFERNNYSQIPTYDAAKKELLGLLEQSVQERLISDVPLGAFLSGGIDSSTVVALASKHVKQMNTFSIGYKDEPFFDETKYANLVAQKYNTNHTVFKLGNDDFFEHVFDLLNSYGEPFADSSAIPLYILSKRTRQKVTVALSGDGGDEIFAGYNKYYGEWKARQNGLAAQMLKKGLPILEKLPKTRGSYWGNKFRQMHRFAESMYKTPQERYWYLCSWQTEAIAKARLTEETQQKISMENYEQSKSQWLEPIQGNDMNELLYADMSLLLPNDMLHKVDSMSMLNSLEVRVPFLDHRIVDFAFRMPIEYKINGKLKKRILQDAVRELLPSQLYNRKKQGFDVPLAKGFQNELRSWIEKDLLDQDFIEAQGMFKPSFTEELKQTIFQTKTFDQNQVWNILAFQHWWKKFMG